MASAYSTCISLIAHSFTLNQKHGGMHNRVFALPLDDRRPCVVLKEYPFPPKESNDSDVKERLNSSKWRKMMKSAREMWSRKHRGVLVQFGMIRLQKNGPGRCRNPGLWMGGST